MRTWIRTKKKRKKESEQRQCERFWFSAPVAVAVRSSCSGRVAFALPFHSSIPRAGRLSMIRKSRKDPPGPAATGKGEEGETTEREKDMLLASLIHRLKLKGMRGKWNRKGKTITQTHVHTHQLVFVPWEVIISNYIVSLEISTNINQVCNVTSPYMRRMVDWTTEHTDRSQ